ncbi:MAG UNVERIFIED_CONTAM: hypothetical protein LVR18_38135 [Planctomycetaceae bacterium]
MAFLEQAVQGLSRKGRVILVQLAVFAQIFRDLEWTPNELRGRGAAGAGERFLEQQFSSVETSERNRRHFDAVCRILEEMLPPAGSQDSWSYAATSQIAGSVRLFEAASKI